MAPAARKHHALAIPLPAQGHLNPLKRLCETLAASHGFTITFLNIDTVHNRLAELSGKPQESNPPHQQQQQHLDIRHEHIPCEGLIDFNITCIRDYLEALQTLVPCIEQLLHKLNQQDLPVTCLISDFSMTLPSQAVADKFNIPRITLFPSSASMLLLLDYVLDGVLPIKEVLEAVMNINSTTTGDVFREGLPGLPTLTNRDLPDMKQDSAYLYEFLQQQLHNCKEKAQAMVVNSFEDLEPAEFETLSARLNVPVFAIGPLMGSSTSLWKEDKGCTEWLDKQPAHSVLFIAFGSSGALSLAQFEEICAALLSSGQHFILVLRPGIIVGAPQASLAAADFLACTREQGRVVEWAPQISILSHPSIGAFLTHCGWNSTLEAIAHGKPMICFPCSYDQFLDAKYVEEVWKVGLRLSSARDDGLVERDEMQRVIKSVMKGEQSKAFRANATKLRDASRLSILSGGTSYKNIESFMSVLMGYGQL